MVVYSKKQKKNTLKAKNIRSIYRFRNFLFMRQDPAYPDLSECNASLDLDIYHTVILSIAIST